MTEVASLVLYAGRPAATAAFYRALGLGLEDEDHGEGPVHFAAEVGPVHFAIYPAEAAGRAGERRSGGSVFPGFYVESLDRAAEALAEVSAPILTSHEEMPWGCRIVAEDPDGRAIEVNQREHCQHAG
jgi:lactoylglutathione lyase